MIIKEGKIYPRILIVSPTILSDETATGSLVKKLFTGWPKARLAQAYTTCHKKTDFTVCDRYFRILKGKRNNSNLIDKIAEYNPDVVYYRSHDLPEVLHEFMTLLLKKFDVQLVTHFMDDWPAKIKLMDAERSYRIEKNLLELFSRSRQNYVISKSMALAYEKRYKAKFKVLHNFPDEIRCRSEKIKKQQKYFVIRYCGSLADDMQKDSIYDIALAVSELQNEIPVLFEVYVNDAFRKNAEGLKKFTACSVHKQGSREGYHNLLETADLLVVAANFDKESVTYIRYSFANKLPEYMVSGTPILAYGPREVETINFCIETNAISIVNEKSISQLKEKLLDIYRSPTEYIKKANICKNYACSEMSAFRFRDKFHLTLRNLDSAAIANNHPQDLMIAGPYPRGRKIDFQEHRIVDEYVGEEKGCMINVGAHIGGSIVEFVDKGWHVYAFEPDPKNRSTLKKRFASHENIDIIADAVSDSAMEQSAFFTSRQSTGISTLAPFDASHLHTDFVAVTTLDIFCQEKELSAVDILMIDAEGYDLHVLRGFPWERMLPTYIICEFEDKKSEKLGYSSHELAEFLYKKGYSVLVSEWHPIKKYGIVHDWRCLKHYPCELEEKDAWGNIIAFREAPDWSRIYEIVGSLSVPKPPLQLRRIMKTLRGKLRT